jgi:hypothetical protein
MERWWHMQKKVSSRITALPIVDIRWEKLNQRLTAVALCVVVVGTVGLLWLIMLIGVEIHDLRVELSAQGAALRTTVDLSGQRIDGSLQSIHRSTQVIQKRADEGLADLRSTVKTASQDTQVAATKQLKSTTEVLKTQLEDTKDAVVGAVQQADTDATGKIPPPVPAPVQPPIVIPIAPPIPPPPPPPDTPKKRKGPMNRLWHHLFN